MNKIELAQWVRGRVVYFLKKDNKFAGVVLDADTWYTLMDELGNPIAGATKSPSSTGAEKVE